MVSTGSPRCNTTQASTKPNTSRTPEKSRTLFGFVLLLLQASPDRVGALLQLTEIHHCGVDSGLAFCGGASCQGFNEVDLELGELGLLGLDYLQCALDRIKAARDA